MKITFEKGMSVHEVLKIFKGFIMDESEDYPLLKNNMLVNITLKNDINQISPNNEREYSFSKVDCDEIKNERKKYADFRLREEWKDFSSNNTFRYLEKCIESDRKYIDTALEKNRKPESIEKRKLLLSKHESERVEEKTRLESLAKFIELVNKDKVKYELIEYYPGYWSELMIFELEDKYIFECDPNVWGECELRKKDSDRSFDYSLIEDF